jgi:hypothetical protein
MTNLSDLFPAGAGKQVSFVADGSISAAGKPVILTAAGKVTPVGMGPGSDVGTPVVFRPSRVDDVSSTFDSNSNKVVFAYNDPTLSFNGYAVVGTVSGTAISFGTPVAFETGGTASHVACTFDSNENKVVIAYRDNSNSHYGTAIVGTVSGTAISYGTAVVFDSTGYSSFPACTFDSDSNKVVIVYQDYLGATPNYQGHAVVGTVSGTSISFGTAVIFNAGSASEAFGATFDSNSNKVVIAYSDNSNSHYGTGIVGTVSGTSISFGSEAVFESSSSAEITATFDSNSNKVVISYSDTGSSQHGTAVVGTVSGTSISFGTPVVFEAADTNTPSATFDSGSNVVVIAYEDVGNSEYGTVIQGTVSGTSISFGSAAVFESAVVSYTSATFDSNSNKVAIGYQDEGNSDYGTGVVYSTTATNLTAANFIGISDAAILDTASGNVTIKGGIAATGLTSLTSGSDYYAQGDGTISTVTTSPAVKIGKAMSATSINLEYQS